MNVDLVIKNTKLVFSSTTLEAGLAVKEGKVVQIAKDTNLPKAEKIIDAEGNFTLPGIIDVHVHFRDPGLTHKEDFLTGSMAAVAGGVTTVIDMPNNIPPTTDVESFTLKVKRLTGRSYVNVGILGLLTKNSLDKVLQLAEAGVLGYKIFLTETQFSKDFLFNLFKKIALTGLRVAVHAEDPLIVQQATEKIKKTGRKDLFAYTESRPSVAEAKAIKEVALLSEKTGCKIHICHLSSYEAVQVVKNFKTKISMTVETCPHYLLLNCEEIKKPSTLFKITPPIRFKNDMVMLWKSLMDGTIDIIASDHSPHTAEEKFGEDIWEVASGFVGVETLVPLMLTQVNLGRLTLNHYVKLACENPAKAFGLYPRKGVIQTGSDADLTIVDMKKEMVIQSEKLHSKTKITPFEGWKVKGMPIFTIVGGNVVMEKGEIFGKPSGVLVSPLDSSNH